MDAQVTWQGNMAFDATASSGFHVKLDTAPSVGGEDDGFRPLELMLVSLAGCTAMDVISILRKKRQDVTNFEVRVNAEQTDDHPHVFTKMQVEYVVTGRGVSADAVKRAIELSETKYCPAQAMLGKIIPMELNFTIHEAEG
jgi:putative redox protein